MSDFDAVLERLLGDAGFQARLAADPAAALAGYRLSDDEAELLRAQVTGDVGGHHRVEQRTSKASLFGLLSPLGGMGSSVSDAASRVNSGGQGLDGPIEGLADVGGGQGLAQATPDHGALLSRNLGDFGHQPVNQSGLGHVPADNYHTRVDVDGDGKWDAHTYVERADGGVDIVVDADHDGRADFVGVDHDRDGLIDESFTDSNHDGVLDTHYVDVNHDGWLDKKVALDPKQGTIYVSENAARPEDGLSAAR
jgi:hypothetical protein